MSGPQAAEIPGRLALIGRFESPFFDQGELASILNAFETFPPDGQGHVVVSVLDDTNRVDELIRCFLVERGNSASVQKVVLSQRRRARLLRWLRPKAPGAGRLIHRLRRRSPRFDPYQVGPLSAAVIDVGSDPLLLDNQLWTLAERLERGGLLIVDDVSSESAARVIDQFLARRTDIEVLHHSYFLVARVRRPQTPARVQQVNLCLNFKTCNLRCPACWTRYSSEKPEATRKPAHVPWEQLDRLLKSPSLARMTIAVIGGGEPLMYPHIGQFLSAAATNERRLMMMSNGTLLHTNPTFWEVAEHSALTLSVSLDAARPETYSFVRQPARWELTRQNIERFARLRDEKNPRLELQTSFVVLRHNVDEVVEFMQLNKEWGSTYVHFHPALSAGYPEEWRLSPSDPKLLSLFAEAMAFGRAHGIGLDPPEQLLMTPTAVVEGPAATKPPVGDPRMSCKDYWRQVAIDVAGETYVCDTAFRVGYSLGNAYRQSIDELWNGARWQSLREAHARREQFQHPLCRHCLMGAC